MHNFSYRETLARAMASHSVKRYLLHKVEFPVTKKLATCVRLLVTAVVGHLNTFTEKSWFRT